MSICINKEKAIAKQIVFCPAIASLIVNSAFY